MKVLLVEDEPKMLLSLCKGLKENAIEVDAVDNAFSGMQKAGENPLRAGAVIAICMQRDPEASIPEFEEIASVAMAVQNMWLRCAELGLGCYWSTPKAALLADDFLRLAPGERCLGLFYLGWHEMPEVAGKRIFFTPISVCRKLTIFLQLSDSAAHSIPA